MTLHMPPLALSPELIPELRVHSDQGAAFLAEDNAQLVLLPVDLPKQSRDQFMVGATCY